MYQNNNALLLICYGELPSNRLTSKLHLHTINNDPRLFPSDTKTVVSNGKSLFNCLCEKCNILTNRAPPYSKQNDHIKTNPKILMICLPYLEKLYSGEIK